MWIGGAHARDVRIRRRIEGKRRAGTGRLGLSLESLLRGWDVLASSPRILVELMDKKVSFLEEGGLPIFDE